MEIEKIIKIVESRLSEKRFHHSKCVMERCEQIAKQVKYDVEIAKQVGIAHDIAKEIPNEEKLEYVKTNKIEIDEIELNNPTLLHAKIGADISIKEFGFSESNKSTYNRNRKYEYFG